MVKRVPYIEICIGILLIIIGFVIWLWAKQLVWIAIYPPPWEKQFIETLPIIFSGLGLLLVIDGARRLIKRTKPKEVK